MMDDEYLERVSAIAERLRMMIDDDWPSMDGTIEQLAEDYNLSISEVWDDIDAEYVK